MHLPCKIEQVHGDFIIGNAAQKSRGRLESVLKALQSNTRRTRHFKVNINYSGMPWHCSFSLIPVKHTVHPALALRPIFLHLLSLAPSREFTPFLNFGLPLFRFNALRLAAFYYAKPFFVTEYVFLFTPFWFTITCSRTQQGCKTRVGRISCSVYCIGILLLFWIFWVLGTFAKLRTATISFAMVVSLSVRMEQLGSH